MLVIIGRCPKCKRSSDNSVGPSTKVKGINNTYKAKLECEDCGWAGETEFYTFFSDTAAKDVENKLKQMGALYNQFLKKPKGA